MRPRAVFLPEAREESRLAELEQVFARDRKTSDVPVLEMIEDGKQKLESASEERAALNCLGAFAVPLPAHRQQCVLAP